MTDNSPLRLTRLPLPPTDDDTARALAEANAEDARDGAGAVVWGCLAFVCVAGVIIGVLLAMVVRH